jgi:hypothetical protein
VKLLQDPLNVALLFYCAALSYFVKSPAHSIQYLALLEAVYQTTYDDQQMILIDFYHVRAQSLGRRVQLVSTLNKIKEETMPSQLRSTRVIRSGDALEVSMEKSKKTTKERGSNQLKPPGITASAVVDSLEKPRKSDSNPVMIKIPKKSPIPKPKVK